MAKARKTKADRDREYAEAERRAWKEFLPKLTAIQTFIDAQLLVDQAPPPDAPGRRYYSNLGFFLGAFTVPAGSNQTERSLYIQFIQRLDAAGALKPGAAEGVLESLRSSLREYPYT